VTDACLVCSVVFSRIFFFLNMVCHRACQMLKAVIALERANCRVRVSQADTLNAGGLQPKDSEGW